MNAGVAELMTEDPKELAARLHNLERKLRLLLRHISGVTWTTDEELRITSIDGPALNELNMSSQEMVGQSIFNVRTGDDSGMLLSPGALEGEVRTAEQWWRGRRVSVTVEPLRDSEGEIVGTMGFAVLLDQVEQADELRAIREELLEARFQASGARISDVVRAGSLVISPAAFAAWKGEHALQLSPTEFKLLLLLAHHQGETMSREALLRPVWGYQYLGESRLVDMTVSRLRQKLRLEPPDDVRIETVRGVGYRLEIVGDQEEASSEDDA